MLVTAKLGINIRINTSSRKSDLGHHDEDGHGAHPGKAGEVQHPPPHPGHRGRGGEEVRFGVVEEVKEEVEEVKEEVEEGAPVHEGHSDQSHGYHDRPNPQVSVLSLVG